MAFAMVETRAALDALDGILDTPGIDGIFLGPSDFSIAWSHGKTINATLEDMMETVKSVAERARKAGKHAAIYVIDPKMAPRLVDMGYRLLAMRLGASADRARRRGRAWRGESRALAAKASLARSGSRAATGTARRPSSLPATGHSRNRR